MPRGAVSLLLSIGNIIQQCQFLLQCLEVVTLLFCDDKRNIPLKTVYVFCRFHSVYHHYIMYFLQSSGNCENKVLYLSFGFYLFMCMIVLL